MLSLSTSSGSLIFIKLEYYVYMGMSGMRPCAMWRACYVCVIK